MPLNSSIPVRTALEADVPHGPRNPRSIRRSLGRFAAGGGFSAALTASLLGGAAAAEPADGAQPRVIGGEGSDTHTAPWVVALTDGTGNHFCGGALISPVEVVTAAHCVAGMSGGAPRAAEELRAVTGRGDLRTSGGTVSEVRSVWVHPGFQDVSSGTDVALLTLTAPVAQPPLPVVDSGDTGAYRPGTPARVYGWGRTEENGSKSDTLRSVEVPISEDTACRSAYPEYDSRSMVCAGTPEGGRDACTGDSGGPLVANGRLIGLVSYGTGCGRPGTPGVYTRLAGVVGDLAAQR